MCTSTAQARHKHKASTQAAQVPLAFQQCVSQEVLNGLKGHGVESYIDDFPLHDEEFDVFSMICCRHTDSRPTVRPHECLRFSRKDANVQVLLKGCFRLYTH